MRPTRRILPAFWLAAVLVGLAAFVPAAASAQTLDLSVDTALGSGVMAGRGDGETVARRTPMYLEVQTWGVIDGDVDTEYGLGLTMQLEGTPALAVTPQVRLLRPVGPVRLFTGLGVPLFVTPFTRLGAEVLGGVIYDLSEAFALLAEGQIDVYFAGSDLPDDGTVVQFNLGLGGRIRF